MPAGGTRQESKARSRRRLLDAALQLLDAHGDAALTTTRIAKLAGLAQPSFYVHFDNVDDLLRCLVDEVLDDWRRAGASARRRSRAAPRDRDRFRETFRAPMALLAGRPALFALSLRYRFDRSSPLGDWSRAVFAELRDELAADLEAAGLAASTPAERRQLAMVADGLIALTVEMVAGHLDGRYPDLDETVDVLVAFAEGHFRTRSATGRA